MTATVSQPEVSDVASADTYRRLATMDPPAMRALLVDLIRLSDESAALAELRPSVETIARAARDAQRAAAAQAALANS
jgi:hypothetical protein